MHGTIDIERIINDADTEFPALFQLFGGYLHEDWRTEYADADAAVAAYKAEAPFTAVHDALVEIGRLQEMQLDDDAVSRILSEGFDCSYLPQLDGVTPSAWLEHIKAMLLPQRAVS